ncbi:kinase-like domain-containing protein [Phaeosphaeriaceae sp. PMI808]|nr:kinase-like domain-containing protein [Phaeosphaeriaceae sp. PMI808]
MHDGSITPPATPNGTLHSKSNSTSSDYLTSLSCIRRGNSTSSRASRPSLDESARPGSTELVVFPYHLTDYTIQVDGEGRKRPIGVGAWSDVYLATPSLPTEIRNDSCVSLTPPITPNNSSTLSTSKTGLPSIPPMYAIKVPGSTSAKKVLNAEARILSYLSRFPSAENHIVPFYGQDTRTSALVLKAMDGTLEDWIQTNLNTLTPPNRAQKLASIFPSIALSLIDSLIWMQEKDCTHADIKPSNILISSSTTTTNSTPTLVFSDFSSTVLSDTPTPPPMGAGTWEFLDPSLLSTLHPRTPCAATDLWSLGITLLYLILGNSPYDAFKHNKYQQREVIKSGAPLQYLAHDDQGIVNLRRLEGLSAAVGFDVKAWLGRVLAKKVESRVGVEEWRAEFVRSLGARV